MNKITQNILWGLILGAPVSVGFAANSVYMDKINQATQKTKSDLHTKYDLPPISQYLSGSASSPSKPSTSSVAPNGASAPGASDLSTPSGEATSPSSSGSWYIQPGDSAGSAGSSGSSGSSGGGFDYKYLY